MSDFESFMDIPDPFFYENLSEEADMVFSLSKCGTCSWQWNLPVSSWDNTGRGCTGSCTACDPPSFAGHTFGQTASTDCY
jgi:hypothetical protein